MEKDKKELLKLSKRVAAKVFAAIIDGADDGDGGVDLGAALNGTAVTLDTLFRRYVEQAEDDITEEQLAEDFYKRLRALQTGRPKKPAGRRRGMNVLQRITISGSHWDDIIALPCFLELNHYNPQWEVMVAAEYAEGKKTTGPQCYLVHVGDDIVQYDDGKWGVVHKKGEHG